MGPSLRNRKAKATSASAAANEENHEDTQTLVEEPHIEERSGSTTRADQDHDPESTSTFRLTPLIQVDPFRRLDVGPFALLSFFFVLSDHLLATNATALLDTGKITKQDIAMAQSVVTAAFALTLVCQVMLVIGAQWSVCLKVAVGFRVVGRKKDRYTRDKNDEHEFNSEEILNWTHCFVEPIRSTMSSSGGGERCGIAAVQHTRDKRAYVNFQDHIFRYCPRKFLPDGDIALWNADENAPSITRTKVEDESQSKFRPLFFPINLPLKFYSCWNGHPSIDHVTKASSIYGLNETLIQLPSFWELLSEQLIAPFFLFQVFCVLLWSLDEYWYYAIFTLCALLMFESTLAYNRQQSLQRLHHAGNTNAGQRVWVRRSISVGLKRSNGWTLLPKTELVPGDYVSISVGSVEGTPVPADIVVLRGSAVCDEALLTGESVPQLKQALDTSDSSESGGDNGPKRLDLQDNLHKESILFGGTKLLVATANEADSTSNEEEDLPPPGARGVTGMVLRTGFETAQGNLLRTMAHSSRTADSIHTWDTFVFILLLVCCALAAAAMVLKEGWYDERRNRFKLFLHVIIIVTSVVPPELPMELSLAVTNSVAALVRRCKVYCSELFRIPWAGEVNVCCFDKTGTLTSDEMRLRGVRLPSTENDQTEESLLKLPLEDDGIPRETIRVMIACHSLTPTGRPRRVSSSTSKIKQVVVGDPLEQAVLNKTGYCLLGGNVVAPISADDGGKPVTILHRFAFSSKLKRMTVLASEEGQHSVWALSKGAPETMKEFLTTESIPDNYDSIAFHHMAHGRRVLAMASRRLGISSSPASIPQLVQKGREHVERNLEFVGFLVLDCPLKPDSKSVISELIKSKHNCVMITGDALLTAVEVARQVGIVPSSNPFTTTNSTNNNQVVVYQIQQRPPSPHSPTIEKEQFNRRSHQRRLEFECVTLSRESHERLPFSRQEIPKLLRLRHDGIAAFSISGDVLIQLAQSVLGSSPPSTDLLSMTMEKALLLHPCVQDLLSELVPLLSVFARHAPHQKEAVIAAFNHGGSRTLMVGDGTNDVGALKRAHVGISILSAPHVEAKQREASDTLSRAKTKHKKKKKKAKGDSTTLPQKKEQRELLQRSLEQLREAQQELDQVELGDASVAAPFTSRAVSIQCVKDVIQQGRCTLVTMLQIYKILGINCLVNAMVLSTLFLHGVKQGDRQLTILGMVVASLFFLVTRGEPLPTLSVERPPSSVLSVQALTSIALQFLVHAGTTWLATHACSLFVDPYDPSLVPDGPFNPNVLNTCTFLLTCVATVNTFWVNYQGRPFVQELQHNTWLYRSLQVCGAVLTSCALQLVPPLNELMQLTTLAETTGHDDDDRPWMAVTTTPGEMDGTGWLLLLRNVVLQQTGLSGLIFGLMVLDTLLTWAVERGTRRFL